MVLVLLAAASLTAAGMVAADPTPEIVVTARKRDEALIAVPVAVTVFNTDLIRSMGLTDLADVAKFTPGFALNSATGRQPASFRPVFRGVTTVRNGVANAGAGGAFVDGIYVSGGLLSSEVANLERVEILRGPQSAQFGRNTYAGAINYVTRQPQASPAGEINLTGAQDDTQEAWGWWTGPLTNDRALLWVGAGHRDYGGEWTNARDGSDVGGQQSTDLSAKLLLRPMDALDVTLRLGYQSTDDDAFPIYLQPRGLNNCCFRTATAPRAREYYIGKVQPEDAINLYTDLLEQNGGAGTQLDRWLGSVAIHWRMGGLTLTSLTGLVKDEVETGVDGSYAAYDPSPPTTPGSFLIHETRDYDDLSQELRLTSATDRPLRFVAGLYYYDGDVDTVDRKRIDPATGTAVPDARGRDEVRNGAVFGGLDWDFAARWTAGLELRWAQDKVTVTTTPASPTGCSSERCSDTFNSLTPRFTLSYRPVDGLMTYANVAEGTKPGDFNSRVPALADGSPDEGYRVVDEETLWNYELGLKAQMLEDRLTLLLAGYYIEVKDQQVTTLVELATGGTASILINAGETDVVGVEAEAQAALSDDLSLTASYAWTQAQYDEYISPEEADLRGGNGSFEDTQRLGDASGQDVPRVPEHMASLAAHYQRALTARMQWYSDATWTYESSKYAQEDNLIETGDQQLLGLRAGLRRDGWDLSLWVRNLLDDDSPVDVIRYFDGRSGGLPSFPQQGSSPPSRTPRGFAIPLAPGRQAGLTVRFGF